MRLEGKRVLITGTAGLIGAAAQTLFAHEGARIVGCDVREGAAETGAATLRDQGYDVQGQTVDLGDPVATEAWIHRSAASLGGIDVLYNNAADTRFAPFADMDLESWRYAMRFELDIVFHTTHPAWQYLLDGGGSVINTASMTALRGIGNLGHIAHATTKGGVAAFTRELAAEGAEHGIRVNAISPGFVAGPATDATVPPDLLAYVLNMHLIRRAGTGEDIAYMAIYLASDESAWVTGQNYSVDGGMTAGYRLPTATGQPVAE
jgi:meso-butanediol dehydrogenase / (S,S)-butanediol dehydrogenase / diacetyl reductase